MSKYDSSLKGPTPWMVHGGQYKTTGMQSATMGRVIIDPKRSLTSREVQRPTGRTGYDAGPRDASCDAD